MEGGGIILIGHAFVARENFKAGCCCRKSICPVNQKKLVKTALSLPLDVMNLVKNK